MLIPGLHERIWEIELSALPLYTDSSLSWACTAAGACGVARVNQNLPCAHGRAG